MSEQIPLERIRGVAPHGVWQSSTGGPWRTREFPSPDSRSIHLSCEQILERLNGCECEGTGRKPIITSAFSQPCPSCSDLRALFLPGGTGDTTG